MVLEELSLFIWCFDGMDIFQVRGLLVYPSQSSSMSRRLYILTCAAVVFLISNLYFHVNVMVDTFDLHLQVEVAISGVFSYSLCAFMA